MGQTFHSLRVKSLVRETKQAVSVHFEVPEPLEETFSFKQGQYITLKLRDDGGEFRRSYSMSSSPLEDKLQITVKKVDDGRGSSLICDDIKEGDELEVSPPQGKFYTPLHPEQKKIYYMIAGGSGITPIMSLIKTTLEVEPLSTVVLFYGNRDVESIIFHEELEQMAKRYEGQFFVEHALSHVSKPAGSLLGGLFKKSGPGLMDSHKGMLTPKLLQKLFNKHPFGNKSAEFFICGPGDMIKNTEEFLLNLGVDKKQVHREYFTTSDDSAPASSGQEAPKGFVKAKVHYNGEAHDLEIPKSKTVLEGLIDQKLDPPYSCSSGACSTCMAKMISGSVKMDSCLALDDDEIEEGYVLTCQARCETDEIELTYDV